MAVSDVITRRKRICRISYLLLLAGAGPAAWSQTPPGPGATDANVRHDANQRYELFQKYLQRRAAEVSRANLSTIHSLEQWKREKPRVSREMRYMLGLDPMPAKTPLEAKVTGVIERSTHRIEKIVFQSMPGLYVTGNLYLPKNAGGPLPTVLYLCGHSPSPHGAKIHYQHHGVWFARNGYAAFLIDTIEYGELAGAHHGLHDLGMWYWLSLGFTPAGPEVWNAIRAIDYLQTRKEVDADRIAITGMSGGGAMTWYTAAVDDRVKVAAPVCATWTVEQQVALNHVRGNCDCIFFHNTFQADLPLAGALIAPRPLKMINATRDVVFPPAGYLDVFRRLEPVYGWHGASDKLAQYEHDAPHEDILPFRKAANEWINRWLKQDNTPFDEGAIEQEPGEVLRVLDHYPPGTINDSIHRRFIPVHELRPWPHRTAWERRRSELIEQIKNRALRLLPSTKVPFETWKAPVKSFVDRYCDASDVEFTTEKDVRVQGQIFIPREEKYRQSALIYVKRSDDIVHPIDWDPLLPLFGRRVVLVLHPRGVDYPVTNLQLSTIKRTAALLGGTLETMQLWDILRSVDFLTAEHGLNLKSISIYGRGQIGPLGFYAAALDSRITRVILDDPPGSHWQGSPLLNILRITDLPETAALLAPRELVSLTPLPPAYDYTASIFALYGKRDAIRQAGGLGEAMQVWEP
ncbi:MAG: acetylxylan esterase [Bryobacteraceae bacterium]|nr:acetylxylan esterase [Bryobacteraceae bacterium]